MGMEQCVSNDRQEEPAGSLTQWNQLQSRPRNKWILSFRKNVNAFFGLSMEVAQLSSLVTVPSLLGLQLLMFQWMSPESRFASAPLTLSI